MMGHAAQVGGDTVISYDANNTVTLQDVAVSSLRSSGFDFT